MSHDTNVNRWYLSGPQEKDRIIVNLMDRLEELENYKVENEARKGVNGHLIHMANRTRPPDFVS